MCLVPRLVPLVRQWWCCSFFFFFNDPATPEIYPLPLHDALPIYPRVARQVVELVDVEGPRPQPRQRLRARAAAPNEREELLWRRAQSREPLSQLAAREVPLGQHLVVRQPGFFQGVGEGVVADVVQQRGQLEPHAICGREPRVPRVLELGEHAPGEMIGPQGVLEAAVGGARIDEEGMAQLAHVAEALHGGRVDYRDGLGVEPDVVPERVANDLEARQRDGPASRTAACTWSWNCSKFCRNSWASFAAWASYAAGSRHVPRGNSKSSGTPGTCSGTSSPNTDSAAVGMRSSLPASAVRTMARVSPRRTRCPTPDGPPVHPVFTSQHCTPWRPIFSPSRAA